MAGFWDSCLLRFEQELPVQQFNTWIKPLRLEGETAPTEGLKLVAPNSFILKWVRDRYLTRIEEYAQAFFAGPISVTLIIGSAKTSSTGDRQTTSQPRSNPITSAVAVNSDLRTSQKSNPYEKSRLFPSFTFDNLIVGKANDLARAASVQVANNPGAAYNPLFIYGGAGLGKTHLIHAIGNTILAENPEKIVRYVHAEDYYSDVVRAYQQKSFDTFKRTYRSLDVLLLDDVQFFNGKNRSQEEFFFLFNAKHLRSNVRELEGALKKVLAYSSFHGRVIALDLAKEALKDLIGSTRNVGMDNIQKTVADYYKIKVAELFSKKRTRAIARPRQVAMWLCREVTTHSFPEIGDAFGGRDHTTVIHAVKTIDSLRLKENELNHDLHVLLQVLKG
jgi:chromosomal replication initiation ATPase DnaA